MGETTEDDNTDDSYPLIIETSAVVFENQRETRETGGASKECKAERGFGRKMIRPEFRSKRKLKQAEVDLDKIQFVEFHADGNHSNQKPTRRDRSGKKCRRSNRSRPIKTRKRKQILNR